MTAFTTSQLPTGTRAIATLEELAVWAIQSLAVSYPKNTFNRAIGQSPEQVCTFGQFQDANNTYRLQLVAVFEVNTTVTGQSLPDWKQVKEMGAVPILSNFTG